MNSSKMSSKSEHGLSCFSDFSNNQDKSWLTGQFRHQPQIETIEISSESEIQILDSPDQEEGVQVELFPKKSKRVNQKVRAKAIHLFRAQKGTISNQMIASILECSVQKVQQMRKQYETTGGIRLTVKNRHTEYFERRYFHQNRIMKKFVRHNRYGVLKDVQNDLREGGYWVSLTNISHRLNLMGYYFNPTPYKNLYCNSPEIVNMRYKYACWLDRKKDKKLFFSAYLPLNFIHLVSQGWYRKNQVQTLKSQIGKQDVFHICLTVGIQGVTGWSVKRKGCTDHLFMKHLKENFDQIHNQGDYLLVNTPESEEEEKQFVNFVSKSSSINFSQITNIPHQSPFLNPAISILDDIKKSLIDKIDQRPMKKFADDGQKQMERTGDQIEYMLENSYNHQKCEYYYSQMRRYALKCLRRQNL